MDKKQKYLLSSIFVSCCAVVALLFFVTQNGSTVPVDASMEESVSSPSPLPSATPEPQPETTTITFSATGDNLIHDVLYNQAARRANGEGYDFTELYEKMMPFYKQYDVNWLNQETLVNDVYPPANYPNFSTPGALGRFMYDMGFRVFSLSNNHTYDKGAGGIDATKQFWQAMPEDCLTVGLSEDDSPENTVTLQLINGIKIAYLSYTEHTNGIPTPSQATSHVIFTSQRELMEQQVSYAKGIADFVVVGLHWGVENSHKTLDTQRSLAQNLADWGADIIIGTHPHVVQNVEWLTTSDDRNVLVAYSLGNFVSAQSSADNLLGAILTLELSKTTYLGETTVLSISNPKMWPIVTHYGDRYSNVKAYFFSEYTPELANLHGVKAYSPHFNYEYAKSVFEKNISPEFLQTDSPFLLE